MNLKIKKGDFEIEAQYLDKAGLNKIIAVAFNYIENGSCLDNFLEESVAPIAVEVPKDKKPKNFTPEVNGVKTYDNGKVTYKCTYNCGCGHKGVRYIVGNEEHVHCHECNGKLSVSPSTLNDAHDEEFNYFLAY